MSITIKFRRGTAAQWALLNPILAEGEPGLDQDSGKFKVGDGATYWNDLPYANGEDGQNGAPGNTNVYIQQVQPVAALPYLWYQVDGAGNLLTVWINT